MDLALGTYYVAVRGAGGYGNIGQYVLAMYHRSGLEGLPLERIELPSPDAPLPGTSPSHSGDFNSDGVIDASDLLRWLAGFGRPGLLFSNGDNDNDGDIDGADMLSWQRNVGSQSSSNIAAAALPQTNPANAASEAVFAELGSLTLDGSPSAMPTFMKPGARSYFPARRAFLM
jgi:hypothetical protein